MRSLLQLRNKLWLSPDFFWLNFKTALTLMRMRFLSYLLAQRYIKIHLLFFVLILQISNTHCKKSVKNTFCISFIYVIFMFF